MRPIGFARRTPRPFGAHPSLALRITADEPAWGHSVPHIGLLIVMLVTAPKSVLFSLLSPLVVS